MRARGIHSTRPPFVRREVIPERTSFRRENLFCESDEETGAVIDRAICKLRDAVLMSRTARYACLVPVSYGVYVRLCARRHSRERYLLFSRRSLSRPPVASNSSVFDAARVLGRPLEKCDCSTARLPVARTTAHSESLFARNTSYHRFAISRSVFALPATACCLKRSCHTVSSRLARR